DFIQGHTVIRPSATSGRYCWLRVIPAANSDGSGAGAPYCSGLPPASTTISLSCRSITAPGSFSLARVPYRVKIRWSDGTPPANFGRTYLCRRWVTTTCAAPDWARSVAISRALIAPPATRTRLPRYGAGPRYWYVEIAPADPAKVPSPGTDGMAGAWNLPLATTTRSKLSSVPAWPMRQP